MAATISPQNNDNTPDSVSTLNGEADATSSSQNDTTPMNNQHILQQGKEEESLPLPSRNHRLAAARISPQNNDSAPGRVSNLNRETDATSSSKNDTTPVDNKNDGSESLSFPPRNDHLVARTISPMHNGGSINFQ